MSFSRKIPLPFVLVLSLAYLSIAIGAERPSIQVDVNGTIIPVYLYEPPGPGPFPLLILSHGSPRDPGDRINYGINTLHRQAESYVTSGVAVAVPIRRGYGGNGKWCEGYGGRIHPDYYSAGLATADDIDAAIGALEKRPEIDATRVVLMGVSAGGWGSLAAATRGGIRGVVNFAGGRGSAGPDDVSGEGALIAAVSRYGKASPIPELWIYSQNDHFFGPSLANQLFKAFTAAGGQATFVAAPPYGDDGHNYIADLSSWRPIVDRFLQRIGFWHSPN